MSEEITRHDPVAHYIGNGDFIGDMEQASDGDWVSFSDYASLANRLAAAERENERLTADNDRLRRDRDDALSVASKYGLLASEWVARTGKAERERDEARRLLEEANEAIRDLVRVGDAMRFSMPLSAMAGKGQYDYIRNLPAVRRALGREAK